MGVPVLKMTASRNGHAVGDAEKEPGKRVSSKPSFLRTGVASVFRSACDEPDAVPRGLLELISDQLAADYHELTSRSRHDHNAP